MPHEVKPLPYRFCIHCMFNGCYPWNTNPALTCNKFGGFIPCILVVDDNNVVYECSSYKIVTEETWQSHLEDVKKEAKFNEESRMRAIDGKVMSNYPLPAESIFMKQVEEEKENH